MTSPRATADQSAPPARLQVCVSEIDRLSVAFSITGLRRFGAHDSSHPRDRTIDLAAFLHLQPAGVRRAAFIDATDGSLQILLGQSIALIDVPLSRLCRLPPLVAGLASSVGILGTLHIDDTLGYLFDTPALLAAVRQREGSRED